MKFIEIINTDNVSVLINVEDISKIVKGYYSNRPSSVWNKMGKVLVETYEHPDSIASRIEKLHLKCSE